VQKGLVGINTIAPSSLLEVNGNVELTNLFDNDASNFFDGSCTNGIQSIDATGAYTCATPGGGGVGGIGNVTGSTLGTSTGTGTTAHDHPIVFTASGNLTDMSVRYTDFIIASKN
jgi:hypothetical protein